MVTEEALTQHVHAKRLWVWEKQAIKKHQNAESPTKQFIADESFEYLGRRYRMKLVDIQDKPLKMCDGWFCLSRDHQSEAKKWFIHWYSVRLEEKINERLKHVFGFKKENLPSIRVIDLGYRWGYSISTGKLRWHHFRLSIMSSRMS